MARHKTPKQQQHVLDGGSDTLVFKQPDKLEFINVSLNAEDKEWLNNQLDNAPTLIVEFLTVCTEQYIRVTVTPDAKSGRWNAIAAVLAVNSPRYGKALSCRGATPVTALLGLAYADGFKDGAWDTVTDGGSDLFG